MNRCFDINLKTAANWTEGEDWSECNPAQKLKSIYSRQYTSDTTAGNRTEPGDNFYIGAASDAITDWSPRNLPITLDINGVEGGELSFYYGLATGQSDIDPKIDNHGPFMVGDGQTPLYLLDANYHRFYGLKCRDIPAVISLQSDNVGLNVDGAVMFNSRWLNTNGYTLSAAKIRNLRLFDITQPLLDLPAGCSDVSMQHHHAEGAGDIGVKIGAGHSDIELVSGKIINHDHNYESTGELVDGLFIDNGGVVKLRYIERTGFSGVAFDTRCKTDARGLRASFCGAGIYIGGANSVYRNCSVAWTRQIAGDSYGYYAAADCELINCATQLDETGGLGVLVAEEGVTVRVTGGDYWAKLPLPFCTAMGNCTFILDNVRINGVVYNETLNMTPGQSWRGGLAPVTLEALDVYNNGIHIPPGHPNDYIANLKDAVSVQGSNRPFETLITLPSGAKVAPMKQGFFKYWPGDGFLDLDPGESRIDYVRYSTPDEIYVHQFDVKANPNVGAKLIAQTAFAGTGWTQSGEQYQCSSTSNVLSASVSLTADKIYQLSLQLTDLSGGSITPQLVGDTTVQATYSHSVEGHEVWLLRAPANTTALELVPDNLSAIVDCIYLREVLTTGTVPTPTLTANGGTGEVDLSWQILPVARLRDTITANKTFTGVLNYNSEYGVRDTSSTGDFLIENASSSGKRSAISLKGGASVEVFNVDITGGYTGASDTWQTGIIACDNGGPYMDIAQHGYVTIDLGLPSNRGNYTAQYGNSDPIVANGGSTGIYQRLYSYGYDLRDGSDANIDTKIVSYHNHGSMSGAYHSNRTHIYGLTEFYNFEIDRAEYTQLCIGPVYATSMVMLWNCTLDGERAVTTAQAQSIKDESLYYGSYGAIGKNPQSVFVSHTLPSIPDLCRFNATDMEFEYSDDSGATWSQLDVPNTGPDNWSGCLKRTVSLAAGTYQIRCRCRNGVDIGAWSNIQNITVS